MDCGRNSHRCCEQVLDNMITLPGACYLCIAKHILDCGDCSKFLDSLHQLIVEREISDSQEIRVLYRTVEELKIAA